MGMAAGKTSRSKIGVRSDIYLFIYSEYGNLYEIMGCAYCIKGVFRYLKDNSFLLLLLFL